MKFNPMQSRNPGVIEQADDGLICAFPVEFERRFAYTWCSTSSLSGHLFRSSVRADALVACMVNPMAMSLGVRL
jgi:hypothetical protein